MKTKLQNYAVALMLGMGLMGVSAPAQAEGVSTFADIGLYSQYVWRGLAQSANNDVSVQGDVGVEHESGLSANIWFATGVDTTNAAGTSEADTEYDITLDYSGEAGDFGYSVGYIRYDYVKNSSSASEYYLGASYSIASATLYIGDTYKLIELGAGGTVADLFDASVTVGYSIPDTGTNEAIYTNIDLSKDITDVVSASLTYAIPQGVQNTSTNSNEVVVGVNASF